MNYTELITKGIKRIRLANNLTQEQFAEKINMSVQGYRNIEQSKYLPTANTIDTICETFNTSPVNLLLPETSTNPNDLQNLVITKIKACHIEKLIKINNILDII